MQQTFQCYRCGAQNYSGTLSCWHCGTTFTWPQQSPPVYRQPVNYQQQYSNNLDHNLLVQTCWFCKQNRAEDVCVLIIPMHGQVKRIWLVVATQVRYKIIQIPVPRCRSCQEVHRRSSSRKWTFGIIGALAGLGGCIGFTSAYNSVSGFLVLCAFFITGLIIGHVTGRIPAGVTAAGKVRDFPLVQQRLRDGWFIGARP